MPGLSVASRSSVPSQVQRSAQDARGGSGGRSAPPIPPADVEEHDLSGLSARPLSEAVELALDASNEVVLSISLDAWIHRYEANPAKGLIELANVMVIAAGMRDVYLDPDRLDVEEQEVSEP